MRFLARVCRSQLSIVGLLMIFVLLSKKWLKSCLIFSIERTFSSSMSSRAAMRQRHELLLRMTATTGTRRFPSLSGSAIAGCRSFARRARAIRSA